ncbi:MAG: LacI family DNA-binding transcriptional regulator [Sphaerochaetaceae bacterium]
MVDKNNSVTIKDVAQSAGVSIATVSRVLNHLPSVALETRKKVLSAMESLQYNRNEVARSLKVRQTKTIGVIAPELNNPFFMEVFEAMERAFAPMGYSMIIASSNGSVEEEKRKLQIFVQRNVDALVVMPAGAEEDHFVQKSVASIPLVMVDRHIEGAPSRHGAGRQPLGSEARN